MIVASALVLLISASGGLSVAGPGATARQVSPGEILLSLAFDQSQFEFSQWAGYDHVRSGGMAYLPEAGLPELPWMEVRVAVPFDARVERVEVTGVRELPLAGTHRIAPTQPPSILSEAAKPWVAGKAAIYDSDQPYPEEPMRGVSRGLMGDHAIVSLVVSPLRWMPATGQLVLVERIELRVVLSDGAATRPARRLSGADPLSDIVARAVANPDEVARFRGSARAASLAPLHQLGASTVEEGYYEYVIVTSQALAPYFEPLAEWKTQKGVPAKTVTLEWIEATYAGANTAERIRNFIIDAYQNWGTNWVLLGGDTGIVPSRQVFAMDCQMGQEGNRIRSDLYYSDLDGNWNANGVLPYGEVADNVDMYPDVVVGRAPAENSAGVQVFVAKVLTYEQNPPADYALDMLMAGEILWDDPYTDSGIGLDMMDSECVPPRFDPILKLYESQGTESYWSVMAAMSAGKNIFLHDGHCNEFVMGVGGGYYIDQSDADSLTNGPRNFILNSIGCWPAAIDRDCIAEHFVENPNGGCVAFIGNSRYGWGSPGNPGYGYSDVIQREFARSLFVDGFFNLGLANADSKAHFVPFAGDANVFRWNEYQINLLGDPEMPVWTDEPRELTVDAPARVQAAGGEIAVVVEDEAGACVGARVCLMNGHDLYLTDLTDLGGRTTFAVTSAYADSLVLTVTAPNHIPHQARIEVVSQACLLEWTTAVVLDGGDGKANPGETLALQVAVKNSGSQSASGVWGTLRALDGRAAVTDSVVYYGSVGGGSVVQGSGAFGVALASELANAEAVGFEMVLVDTLGAHWISRLPLVVACPVLDVTGYAMHDLAGDADWIAEPGETISVALELANSGLTSGSAEVHLATADPYLAVEDLAPGTGIVGPGAVGYSHHRVVVAGGCPEAHVGLLEATVDLAGGGSTTDTVYFAVGDLAFSDDCEGGVGGWTHGGTGDGWHLSSYRSHSGSASWYSGSEATHTYGSDANAGLVSQEFVAGAETRLAFWFWYDFTTYGVDGIYVIATVNGVPDTLDYFGSGGALNIASRWVKWERSLDNVTPGDHFTVKFGFKTDDTDVAEGIYLDDISLTSRVPDQAGVDDGGRTEVAFSVLPNPARGALALSFSGAPCQMVIGIYDISGRRVARLVKPAGSSVVSWNLADVDGGEVAPGIYIARVEGGGYTSSRKVVVLR